MSSSIRTRPVPDIEYPDSDGMPMAENTLQFKWIVVVKEGLDAAFRHDPDVFVAGDLLWYPVHGKPKERVAPDALVAFGRPKGYRGSYKQWEEGGIPPQVVFEILSPGNRPAAMGEKFQFYERHGVEEYYIYNPEDGELLGYRRVGGALQPIPQMAGYTSPLLGIRFEPGAGPDNLAIFGPDGERFLTYQEIMDERNAERQRANDAERQRAEAERQKAQAEHQKAQAERERAEAEREKAEAERQKAQAEHQRAEAERQKAQAEHQKAQAEALAGAERQRAERLAAKLRELGIEPD